MFNSFVILILFVLSSQVFPVALGIETSKNTGKAIWFGLLLVLGQFLFLLFGLFLGDRFIHLVEEFKGTVVFVGFFLIGLRMLMDTFKVRKGERTFSVESSLQVVLASSAQGINTFLAGLIFAAFAPDVQWLSLVLLVLTVIFTGIGLLLKPTKQSFVLSSLFFALGGLIMIVSSIYFGFII
jgi:putative Mn2+ efflux pump MntP